LAALACQRTHFFILLILKCGFFCISLN